MTTSQYRFYLKQFNIDIDAVPKDLLPKIKKMVDELVKLRLNLIDSKKAYIKSKLEQKRLLKTISDLQNLIPKLIPQKTPLA